MRKIVLFILLAVPLFAITGPVNQGTGGTAGGVGITVTITAPTAGNALVAVVGCQTAGVSVSSITGGGVTWASDTGGSNTDESIAIWHGFNSSGSGTSVVITMSTNAFCTANVSEWNGIDAIDGTASSTSGSCTNFTTPSITTTASASLVIGAYAAFVAPTSATPNAPFTNLTTADATMGRGAYLITSSAGSYSANWNDSQCVNFETAIAGYKLTGGGGGPAVSPARRMIIFQ